MKVSPISFTKAFRTHSNYENAQKLTQILNSKQGNDAAISLKRTIGDLKAGKATLYRDYEGQLYILSGKDAAFFKSTQNQMNKIRKQVQLHMSKCGQDERGLISHKLEADEKENYYDKINKFISRNPIQDLHVTWNRQNDNITGYAISYKDNAGIERNRVSYIPIF